MIFERIDTWLILWLVCFLVICWAFDRHTRIKRMEMEKAEQRKQIQILRAENRQLRKEAMKLANRKETAISHTVELWQEEVKSLKAEIAMKDNLLNQKWKAANGK